MQLVRATSNQATAQGSPGAVNRIAIEQSSEAQNHAFLFHRRGNSPQEFLNYDSLVCGMRETNQVDRIQVRQDDDGDYWIVITAEAGSVGISLSSNHQLNPNRIKLEAWAEDQLRRDEQRREPIGSVPGS